MANHDHQHDHSQDGLKRGQKVAVVMVPLPAQGHLNQLLHLSRLIATYNIPVHYVGTATHNRQARLRVHGWDPLTTANIHFHDFLTPSYLSARPKGPTTSGMFPSQLMPLFYAISQLREPVSTLLSGLSARAGRVIVIFDTLMVSVVQDVASIPNAEPYRFHCVSAFTKWSYLWEIAGKPIPPEVEIEGFPSNDGCFTPEFIEFRETQRGYMNFHSGSIFNTSRVIDDRFLDFLEKEELLGTERPWALGPFNPLSISKDTNSDSRHKCLEWLDRQPPNSVIFVSFGTTSSLPDEQINELAIGLEKSGKKFIWVLRDADEGEGRRAELPEGYEERVEEKGLVVRDWAPQLEILGHPSTGGFMSHCGWNSCIESISMGKPIAAWPMHSDQPRNAVFVTEVLKIGVVVKDWARQDELVTGSAIEAAVKRLMASAKGDEMRKRAAELGGAVRESVTDGGATRSEFDSFIAHITR